MHERETVCQGQLFLHKHKRVEFVIFVLYRKIADFGDSIGFVLPQVAAGIKAILENTA